MSAGEVDRFVASLEPHWQRATCARLLADVRAAPGLTEHLKWGQPYFAYEGAAVTKWFCARDWVNVYFFRGRELPDPRELFEPSDNQRMLTVKVTSDRKLDRAAFRALVQAAVEHAASPGAGRRQQ